MRSKTYRKLNRRRLTKTILSIGTAVAIFVSMPLSVLADPDPLNEARKAEQDRKEQQLKQEIAQNQQQLDQLNSQVGNLQSQQNAINSQISELNGQIAGLMANISILESDIQVTENVIYETQLELDAAIQRENEQYDSTMTRIKCMYEQGETNYVTLLVMSNSLSEFLSNAEYIEKVYQYDKNLLAEYKETKREVQELKAELEEQEEELRAAREDLLSQKAELDEKVSGLRAIASDFDVQIASARRQAETYAARIKLQNAEVQKIEAERAALLKEEAEKTKKATAAATVAAPAASTGAVGGTAIMTGNVVSAGPNAKFHGPNYTIDTGVITSAPGSDKGKEVCMYAIQFLGNPYVHAGRSLITGTDCSGFTMLVYKHFGINISPASSYQSHEGRSVSYADAQPGDVVVYPGHVALYLGNGKVVHASSSSSGIKISNVNYRSFTDIRRML